LLILLKRRLYFQLRDIDVFSLLVWCLHLLCVVVSGMAPCKDARRAGQSTRSRLAQLNTLQERREKAIERSRKFRERKRALLQNSLESTLHATVGSTDPSVNID